MNRLHDVEIRFGDVCFNILLLRVRQSTILRNLEGTANQPEKVPEKRLTLAPQKSRTLKALFIIHSIE